MVTLCLLYVYNVIGIECFSGLIDPSNPHLNGTDFAADNYYQVGTQEGGGG